MRQGRQPEGSETNRAGADRAGWLEACLWVAALLCLGVVLTFAVRAHAASREAAAIGQEAQAPAGENPMPVGTKVVQGSGAVMGRLEIGKVGLNVPVLENYDPATLREGVGHIPGTALPGGLGNVGLAGHRDTFLRPIRNVKLGMEMDLVTRGGTYRYKIDSTEIVTPEQVEVLDIRSVPELTVVTCYPFNFIGAAPKRFIVHAHLVSLLPG